MRLIATWIINALALLALPYIFDSIRVDSFFTALVTALVLGLLNALIRPLLFLLTLPINLVTLGLFTFVINGLLFWFVASFVSGLNCSTGFGFGVCLSASASFSPLHASKTNSTDAIEPETPHERCITGSGCRKFLEQIITSHHPRVLLRLTASIGFLVEEFALRVNQRAIRLDRANHKCVGQVLRT